MSTATLVERESDLRGDTRVVLCSFCERQRSAELSGPELEELLVGVVSGCCHDCGGGWCLCRGALDCPRCPRKNSPVIVDGLKVFRIHVPAPPSTEPRGVFARVEFGPPLEFDGFGAFDDEDTEKGCVDR